MLSSKKYISKAQILKDNPGMSRSDVTKTYWKMRRETNMANKALKRGGFQEASAKDLSDPRFEPAPREDLDMAA